MPDRQMDKFEILKKYFGYDCFREGQETLIDAVLAGKDVLGIMPTGAGKSLCYQVPALLLPGITIVISPLISLMKDQVQALNQAGIHAAYINSSLTDTQIAKALRLAGAGRYKIIYAAPERLETYEFLEFVRQVEISMVTVDEAHCISQWGQDFRPSYLNIIRFIKLFEKRPVIGAFTATATEAVKNDIICVLGLRTPEVLVTGFDRKNLYFAVETVRRKDAFLLNYLEEHSKESGIIYCATRKNVDMLYEKLTQTGVPVTRYHAGLGSGERKQNQEAFIYDEKPVMIATNAFGMGIDKSNVRYVIHYNMPQSMENYYQEAGRAGRDGEPAECILLYSAQDLVINRFLLESKEQNAQFSEEERRAVRERDEERLKKMSYYCLTGNCLREYILRYFGEQGNIACQNCSNCLKEFEQKDVTEEAKKIISCVREMQQHYGINVVAGTLAGENRAKLREYGVASYSSYGALKEMPEAEKKQIINQMLIDKILYLTNDKYRLVKLGTETEEIENGTGRVAIKVQKDRPASQFAGKEKSAPSGRRSDILNSKGLACFDALRGVRMEIAREESMPPYIIFSDKTLVEMCIRLPFTKEEMLRISGVGENKFEKYGERFLVCIREFTDGVREKYYFGEEEEFSFSKTGTGKRKEKTVKQEFFMTEGMLAAAEYEGDCLLSEFTERLNKLRDPEEMKRLTAKRLMEWLKQEDYVRERFANGFMRSAPTAKGSAAGITVGMRMSAKGKEYEDLYYGEEIQKKILSVLQK